MPEHDRRRHRHTSPAQECPEPPRSLARPGSRGPAGTAPDDDRPETAWLEHVTDVECNAKRTRRSH
ncbi:hypothetical protein [Streptomyces sp. NPDC087298]|uniref:hypothetical protein n=1 Tax=Streptomyces sp. NPDC087298 TaxID=3365779 RepID=UPI0038012FE1